MNLTLLSTVILLFLRPKVCLTCSCVHMDLPNLQILFVGGLFPLFSSSAGDVSKTVVDQSGVRRMAAVQIAMNRINNKNDGIFDDLLPQTKVCCRPILWCTVCCFFN